MDQETRNKLQRATQQVRRILEEEFAEQLEGTFDILPDGKILPEAGKHLDARQRLTRQKLVDAIEHIKAGGKKAQEAVDEYTREAAFTFLNRFVALRMLEARGLLQECVSKGDQSSGFKEFCGLAPGLASLPDDGYRLYLECLFDELTVEIKVLFDRRDPASLLWPRRGALTELLDTLNQHDLAGVWSEDETIGWVYQYFNSSEERKKMREESQAPRNSRELAVRNQFFTPRYVVEFLTDNTLGRIWYEMRQGQTRLVDECRYLVRRPSEVFLDEGQEPPVDDSDAEQDLSQEELLKKTVYIPHRAKKDPRDLKILDPACGSGHFLLYAFDLLISIYDEAWHDEASPKSEVTGRRLRDDYPELEQLHAALPGLVLAHNLHGIDIDPRAAQIAALALWMRGQRAFNEFQIAREQRPAIARSNIVCAEPMPGEAAFLDEFIAEHLSNDAEGRFLASLVRKVFEAMKLAGEAGSLLKIEEDIAEEVAKAKKQWLERPEFKQKTLFDAGPKAVQQELDLTRGITDETFWEEAEQRIYDALRAYSQQAEQTGGYQRRLFAVDAARGFALIDLCRQRYDVALMNPPFGAASGSTKSILRRFYPRAKQDLYACFVDRASEMLQPIGFVGAITSRTGFFLTTFKDWRQATLLGSAPPRVLADLGMGVLDSAMVETMAYCLCKQASTDPAVFIRAVNDDDRSEQITQCVDSFRAGLAARGLFLASTSVFDGLPNKSFGYWLPMSLFSAYQKFAPFECDDRYIKVGLQTSNDDRFVRTRWEVEQISDDQFGKRWFQHSKGGGSSRFFSEFSTVVNWYRNGRELWAFYHANRERVGGMIKNASYYHRPGISWAVRASTFSPHFVPAGGVFSVSRYQAFASPSVIAAVLAIMNSAVANALLRASAERFEHPKFIPGIVGQLPIPNLSASDIKTLESLARRGWEAKRTLCSEEETSQAFVRPMLLRVDGIDFNERATKIHELRWTTEDELQVIKQEINELCYLLYEVTHSDRIEIQRRFAEKSPIREDIHDPQKRLHELAISFLSWAIGAAFGRFDVRSANGGVLTTDPFGEIPKCLPGMLSHESVVESLREYPIAFVADGILVDDVGNEKDIEGYIQSVFIAVFGDNWDAWWQQCLELASGRTSSIRVWFQKRFFDRHVVTYSDNRRKAPIYWQLANPSASYSIWLYYHRFTKDTFFKVLNEYVKPKLDHERQKLERLRGEAGAEPTRAQRKAIEDQEKFVAELVSMAEEVERIAPLWNPNLNDGVIINFAPLWRLVPQNKSWQKECKSCWDKLVKGDYDWAHLAMHLWPERVVPKCVTDASLAIAHGLEDTFWQQDDRDRFQPLEEPEGGWDPVIKELVEERTSPAVKAALSSLLEAPAPAGSTRTRRRRAAAT